jgi:hypothetical protein
MDTMGTYIRFPDEDGIAEIRIGCGCYDQIPGCEHVPTIIRTPEGDMFKTLRLATPLIVGSVDDWGAIRLDEDQV